MASPEVQHVWDGFAAAGEDGYLRLTDDEIVAVAARGRALWPSPVPTVDRTNSNALQAAVVRGARSLVARQLLTPPNRDLLEPTLQEIVDVVLDGRLVAAAWFVDEQMGYAGGGMALAAYRSDGARSDGDGVMEVVGPEGLHTFAFPASTGHWERVLAETLKQVADHGWAHLRRPDTPEPAYLSIINRAAGVLRAVVVRASCVRDRPLEPSGRGRPALPGLEIKVDEALTYLELE